MKDDLKRYVDQHRPEFEIHKPEADALWAGISSSLDQHQKKGGLLRYLEPYYKIAAVLILSAGVAFSIYRTQYPVKIAGEIAELNAISPELGETESYYQGLINEKMEYLQANSELIDPIILSDLEVLDEAFVELKEDLADNVDNEEVVNAMIRNYRIKLEILERILTSRFMIV